MGTPILAHGAGHFITYFPLLFVGAAVFFIVTALRDGSGKNNSTRTLPTSPLSRQVWMATRRQRRSVERAPVASSAERTFRRMGAPTLQVMEGEAESGNRPRIPQTFQPPPPTRRRA